MAVLKKYHKQLNTIEKGAENEAYRIIAQNQKEIIELNTKGQLLLGKGVKGQKLIPKYSRVRYARAKNRLNPLAGIGTPDLKLTGKFYDEFFLSAKNRQLEFSSSAEYTKYLVKKYGVSQDIFGLTKENSNILNDEILLPKLAEWLLKNIKI